MDIITIGQLLDVETISVWWWGRTGCTPRRLTNSKLSGHVLPN